MKEFLQPISLGIGFRLFNIGLRLFALVLAILFYGCDYINAKAHLIEAQAEAVRRVNRP